MPTTEATGLIGWIDTYGTYLAFFFQLLYWIAISAAAVFAAVQFKRLVDNACDTAPTRAVAAVNATVSVEEFTD